MILILRSRCSSAGSCWGGLRRQEKPGCRFGKRSERPSPHTLWGRTWSGSRSSRTPALPRSSIWHGPGDPWIRRTAARLPVTGSRSLNHPKAPRGELDPATSQWLAMAEQLLALRIVYLVSQFAHPLRSMSAQLIYGPILLLLAVAWYPFHPLK